jgi:hypothetical protein
MLQPPSSLGGYVAFLPPSATTPLDFLCPVPEADPPLVF